MRRKAWQSWVASAGLLASVLLTGCGRLAATDAAVEVYFENGRVFTATGATAEAVAIGQGEILFVGSRAEGEPYRQAAHEVIDLAGGMLLPGFIDAHTHAVTPEFFDFTVLGHQDVPSLLAAVQEFVTANPERDAYYGFGYNIGLFEGPELVNGPRRELLDAITSKPLTIYAIDGHSAWLNTAAFDANGVSPNSTVPIGGRIPIDEATGEIWGTVNDGALALISDPVLSPDQLDSALANYVALQNSLGYTSIHNPPADGYFAVPWEGYQRLLDAGELTIRVTGSESVRPETTAADLARLVARQAEYSGEYLRLGSAKIFIDGILGAGSAYLAEPYEGTDATGSAFWDVPALTAAIATANEMGIGVHCHAIGDAAVTLALDAISQAHQLTPPGAARNSMTHLLLVAPQDFQRFAELDVTAVLQAFWHFKQPGAWDPVELPALGARAEREWPLGSFVKAGARVALSSDFPVTNVPTPFYAIEAGITRNLPDATAWGLESDIADMNDPEFLLWPQERVDIQTMLLGYTINAAYALGIDDRVGTLEVGKAADLLIVDQDLLAVAPLAISDTRVVRTYVAGRLVFDALGD